jgi:hypothetical protein
MLPTVDIEAEPLRAALADLRDAPRPGWRDARTGDEADAEVAHRMRTLRLAVAAIAALRDRGEEEPTPAQVREEMAQLALQFVFEPAHLLELAEAARDAGEHEDAATLEQAFHWHLALAERGATLN